MKQIVEFTDSPYQTGQIPLEGGSTQASITLYWSYTQRSWYFDMEYGNIISSGNKLCLGANTLRCFKSLIPFGLMVVANDSIDPYQIEDLQSQRVKIYVLNKTEVQQIERLVYNE